MTARKVFRRRVCKEEDCREGFIPTHHNQTRCSDRCKGKAAARKSARYKARQRTLGAVPVSPYYVRQKPNLDGQVRSGEKSWARYCLANPYYFQSMFPQQTLLQAVAWMKKIGVFVK
jgi:hypothetical protein